ncbi:hypothetical protein MGN70_003067 [Eutypa lata]|nr:hypothetical protein MGN70_003067 [Eutypa lata]
MKPNERWGDWPRRQERKLRKTVGLPASGDVGNISTLVRELKEATGKYLGVSIQSASACIPTFPAIYDEDLYERLNIKHPETCWEKDNGFEGYYYVVDYPNSSLFASLLRMNWKGPYTGRDLLEYSLKLGSDFQHKTPDEDHY